MQLYCMGHSGHSYKVANYLNLAGLPFEMIFVDFFNGEGRSPEFRALNDMAEVPVFIDGDIKLTQSGVILEYLIDKTGHFAPTDRFENLRWVLWDNHKMSSVAGQTRFYKNFLPKEKQSADVSAYLQGRLNAALQTLNSALEGRDFLVGNSLSPADFSCSSYLWYPEDFGFNRDDYPHINAWLARIENMPNWKHPYDLMPTDQSMLNRSPAAAQWQKA